MSTRRNLIEADYNILSEQVSRFIDKVNLWRNTDDAMVAAVDNEIKALVHHLESSGKFRYVPGYKVTKTGGFPNHCWTVSPIGKFHPNFKITLNLNA